MGPGRGSAMAKGDRHLPRSCNRATPWAIVGAMDEGTRRSDGPVARLAIAAVAIAACRSESKPAPALTRTAQPPAIDIDAAAAFDAPATVDAGAVAPTLASCPPSAYRNDGRSIMSIIPFVFPGCPSPELDLEEVYCAGCARPCGWQRVTAIDGHALPGSAVRAYYDDAGRLAQLGAAAGGLEALHGRGVVGAQRALGFERHPGGRLRCDCRRAIQGAACGLQLIADQVLDPIS